jgi:cell division topological specificity factor
MKRLLSDIFKDIITGCNSLIAATLSKQDTAKETACNRLKLVLMHDRTKLDPSTLERMRDELVEVISRYVEIDQELLDLNLASEGNSIALVASIPVIRAKQIEDPKEEKEEVSEQEASLEEILETEVVELDDELR